MRVGVSSSRGDFDRAGGFLVRLGQPDRENPVGETRLDRIRSSRPLRSGVVDEQILAAAVYQQSVTGHAYDVPDAAATDCPVNVTPRARYGR